MEPIFTSLEELERLAERIHTHLPIGRSLSVVLSNIADGLGNFQEQKDRIEEEIQSLYDNGWPEYARDLQSSFYCALSGEVGL